MSETTYVDAPFGADGTVEVSEEPWEYPAPPVPDPQTAAAQQAPATPAPAPATAAALVSGLPGGTVTPISGRFPMFEGASVAATQVKLAGEAKAESLAGLVVGIDDRVRLVGEYKVIGVRHFINKDGELVREMIFKASNVELAPWDPADPKDDGVVRARP